MILPFSTQMNGKPNYFIEKIWEGLLKHIFCQDTEYIEYLNSHEMQFGKNWDWLREGCEPDPKIHTIREDKNDRWKPGTKIDFFINCRQKDMFRFTPVLPVVSVQGVEIIWVELFGIKVVHVFIEKEFFAKVKFDSEMIVKDDMLRLAKNDGFDTIEDFFAYFNKDFKGKLIHWTDLKY
ncbi:hypothetical protein EKM01_03755 [Flavobacterium sp. RSP46]|uniref:hypothetical protein n=1 Tax=Flavobacterium sp. RSP46 TaxID=2497486 RepID=UPI000F8786FD|nr:hypothetical protein [Flavobacterium sp. RSP46]RTY93224.1 hypothetical protein EKM01_03755 [Flavobacterium sp. RSP46]